tara:strand:+ start:19090 stop:19851 length:762 start_codon:yes stop_codon:yes gene_type:complete
VSRKPFASSQNTPLKNTPYDSRVGEQEFPAGDDTASDNYVLLGFRAGYALQAAELNEIQEHFYLQQTLMATMISNWSSAIGQNQGPGWGYGDIEQAKSGMTPLSPNMVTRSGDTVTFSKGWYLVQVPKFTTTDETVSYRFKIWIYSNEDISFTANQPENSSPGYVGFKITQEFVTETEDGDLSDGANASENIVPGATRYKLSVGDGTASSLTQQGRDVLGLGSGTEDSDDSPMCIKIVNNTFSYLNDYELPTT